MNSIEQNQAKYNRWIWAISIFIPVAVALLFRIKLKNFGIDVEPLTFLPPIYATINGITAVVLVAAYVAIRKGNVALHERLMKTAIFLSILFLIGYIAYHITSNSTAFGGQGLIRPVYYSLLISHIILSIAIIPLVLISFVRALSQRFDKHRKIARITLPLWLYVAITGVVVYLMIAPYYNH
jgi:putative membrane protein